ncbi:hypothetical protein ACIODW_06060 [Streptomyces sp. NPDC087897]|uniref:hypothetical protein n=1 Tax=Streptomyces sp. NPDC087897 TaxID=3365817 RepID=UPI00380105CA
MDAGIAAVLGAVVGALGTGGAGVIAALLAKSQVRMQIQAEHARMIREPRKQAYASYAESAKKDYERLSEARLSLELAAQYESRREELLTKIGGLIDESYEHANTVLETWEAQVYIEGPHAVVQATVRLGNCFVDLRSVLLENHGKIEDGEEADLDVVREKHAAVHMAYLDYLYRASAALNADVHSA